MRNGLREAQKLDQIQGLNNLGLLQTFNIHFTAYTAYLVVGGQLIAI